MAIINEVLILEGDRSDDDIIECEYSWDSFNYIRFSASQVNRRLYPKYIIKFNNINALNKLEYMNYKNAYFVKFNDKRMTFRRFRFSLEDKVLYRIKCNVTYPKEILCLDFIPSNDTNYVISSDVSANSLQWYINANDAIKMINSKYMTRKSLPESIRDDVLILYNEISYYYHHFKNSYLDVNNKDFLVIYKDDEDIFTDVKLGKIKLI